MPACQLFQNLAKETWDRIEFTRSRSGLKIFETTITQNLLYNLTKSGLPNIHCFEALNEKTDGNDIVLCIQNATGLFDQYMIQAKIIYKNSRFGAFCGLGQTHDLIQYSNNKQATPIYLFYNYGDLDPGQTLYAKSGYPFQRSDLPLYGCSVAHAYSVLGLLTNSGRPSLTDVNEVYALPWHLLPCNDLAFSDGIKKKSISQNEIENSGGWKKIELTPPDLFKNSIIESLKSSMTLGSDDEQLAEKRAPSLQSSKYKILPNFNGSIKLEKKDERLLIDVGGFPFENKIFSGNFEFRPKFRIVIKT